MRPRNDCGFTLVELLVVVVVLGILSAVTVLGVARFRSDGEDAACRADVVTVTRAAVAYEAATGQWPADLDALTGGDYLTGPPAGTFRFDRAARTVTRTPACLGATGAIAGVGGKCIDVAGETAVDGATVQLSTCAGRDGQRWTVPAFWPGQVMVLGKCLSVAGGSTADRAAVQLSTCDGSAGQQWDHDAGLLRHPSSGRCLDAENAASADGTRLIIWSCHGAVNQRWALP